MDQLSSGPRVSLSHSQPRLVLIPQLLFIALTELVGVLLSLLALHLASEV